MVGDRPGVLPAQVPVAVVRQCDQRGRVGGGAHRDPQLVLPGQRVEAAGGDDAGVPFLAVARDVRQPQRRPVGGVHRLRRPDHLVPALDTAVQVVRAVVGRHREPTAVELERPVADPVRHPPDRAAEVLRPGQIPVQVVEAQDDVGQLAVAVGRLQTDQRGPVRGHLGDDVVAVGQRVEVDVLPVSLSKQRLGDGHGVVVRLTR